METGSGRTTRNSDLIAADRGDSLEQVCAALGLTALFLHGSRATGHARLDSDADFAHLLPHGQDSGPVEDALRPFWP
jgi:hypothetical protein